MPSQHENSTEQCPSPAMSRKAIFLMGAPSGRLQWNDKDLLDTAVPPFGNTDLGTGTLLEANTAKWRVLKKTSELQSSQLAWTEDTVFLNTTNLSSKVPKISEDILLSQFYEHSLFILGTSYSSELDNNDTTLALDDSDLDESTRSVVGPNVASFVLPRELHDIKDIPNAAYLRSIVPQTPSVTLVVAIVRINPIRRVTARHSKQELDILELIVGDETRTGFGVTFWLPLWKDAAAKATSDSDYKFRQKVCGLRPRDIVLITNVGLGSFQDLVYGQSLRRGMTRVDLLSRQHSASADEHGVLHLEIAGAAVDKDRLLNKVQQVRTWLMNFIGTNANHGSHSLQRPLPPDTQ